MVNEWILVMVVITLDQNSQLEKVWEILDIPEVEALQDQTSNTKGETKKILEKENSSKSMNHVKEKVLFPGGPAMNSHGKPTGMI